MKCLRWCSKGSNGSKSFRPCGGSQPEMTDPAPVYVFRDRSFAPAGDTVVCAAPRDLVVSVYGGGALMERAAYRLYSVVLPSSEMRKRAFVTLEYGAPEMPRASEPSFAVGPLCTSSTNDRWAALSGSKRKAAGRRRVRHQVGLGHDFRSDSYGGQKLGKR